MTSFNNIAVVFPDNLLYILAQYGSGPYGGGNYNVDGAEASAPNTGLLPSLIPDSPVGWALLVFGLLAIAASLYLLFKSRNKK